jgi:hypothetical protein
VTTLGGQLTRRVEVKQVLGKQVELRGAAVLGSGGDEFPAGRPGAVGPAEVQVAVIAE